MTEMQTSGKQKVDGFGMDGFCASEYYHNKKMGSCLRPDAGTVQEEGMSRTEPALAITPLEADFLADFIANSAFYVEQLEDLVGEEMIDFWQCREHAYRIITQLLIRKLKIAEQPTAPANRGRYRTHQQQVM